MNKVFRTLLTAVASIALALGFAVSPANAATSRTIVSDVTSFTPGGQTPSFTASIATINTYKFQYLDIGVTGPPPNWSVASTCSSIAFANLTADLDQCKVTSIKVNGVEDKTNWKVYYYQGSFNGMRFARDTNVFPIGNRGYSQVSGATGSIEVVFDAGAFTVGSAGNYQLRMNMTANGGSTTDEGTVAFISGSGSSAPSTPSSPSSGSNTTPAPSASATPTTTAATTPAVGTAAALAELPKASTQPKLKFDSSANGLGKSAKKSLKKVAEVAKDGYGVRVTGAAGMQAGVSKDVVKALAKKRAMEIRAYLIKQGVPKEDIIIKTKIFPIGKAPATLVKVETLD